MRIFQTVGLVLACTAGGCGAALALETKVQPNYAAMSMNLDNNGDLVVVSWLYPAGGTTAVCGMYFPEKPNGGLDARVSKMLKNLTFRVGGKNLRVLGEKFTEYESEEAALAAKTGRCQGTKVPWADAYATTEVEIDFRSQYLAD